ncbi:MAG: Asp-tRNA(Asn)/Glu-tRNA(Gln) amidotransferase subunit GatA [Verrucomicrobiota bacterium]
MNLETSTIAGLKAAYQKKTLTPLEATQDLIQRIQEVDPKLNAYLRFNEEDALQQAKAAEISKPLGGIPIAIKDNIVARGEKATCASKILQNFVSPYDATVISKLKEAGAILVGRMNMDEFAMGSSCEYSALAESTTRNPWNQDCIPGGSSGGSAAAVGGWEAVAALGSDTGGSIRQPAALCGCVGMKPTYGRVSRFGLVAFASSLDQIGPLTHTVEDTALLLNAISGHDPQENTSHAVTVPDFKESLNPSVKGLKIGIPQEYFIEGIDSEVAAGIQASIDWYQSNGAEIIDVSLPHTNAAVAVYYIVATAEASANLARFDGVRYGKRTENPKDILDLYRSSREEGFGQEVKRRIILGTYVLSSGYYDAYYNQAQKVRQLIREDFVQAFQKCDVILTPTSPSPAFKTGEKMTDPLQMYLADIFTIAANLSGIPGISIPCGFTQSGLPVGLQLLSSHFEETKILHAAYAYEQAHEWYKQQPAF